MIYDLRSFVENFESKQLVINRLDSKIFDWENRI